MAKLLEVPPELLPLIEKRSGNERRQDRRTAKSKVQKTKNQRRKTRRKPEK